MLVNLALWSSPVVPSQISIVKLPNHFLFLWSSNNRYHDNVYCLRLCEEN